MDSSNVGHLESGLLQDPGQMRQNVDSSTQPVGGFINAAADLALVGYVSSASRRASPTRVQNSS